MKKITTFALMLCMLFSVVSFAQAKSAPAQRGKAMTMGLGIDGGYTALKFSTDDLMGSVGFGFASASGNSSFALAGKMAYNLSGGNIPTHAGGGIEFASATNFSSFTIRALYGAETTFANKLNFGFDIYPFSYTSQTIGGTTSTSFTLGGGTVYAYLNF